MKLDFCAVCGTKDDLHLHHIDPIVHSNVERKSIPKYDNTKQIKDCTPTEIFNALFDRGFISEHATLTLCSYHHKLMHGIVKFQQIHHQKLVRDGLEKAKANGVKLGRPKTEMTDEMMQKFDEMKKNKIGVKKICKELQIGCGTYYDIIKEKQSKRKKPRLKYSDYFDLPQSIVQ